MFGRAAIRLGIGPHSSIWNDLLRIKKDDEPYLLILILGWLVTSNIDSAAGNMTAICI